MTISYLTCAVLLSVLLFFNYFDTALGQTTTCDDAFECEDDTISSTYVKCLGYFGCDEANITGTYTYLYGDYAAYKATIDSTYIYNYGYLGSYYATIATYAIYSRGYYSALYADIEPLGSTLYAYFSGFFAGYSADVSCFDGDTCYVYCGASYGCYNLKYYCYSGATCSYDCSDDSDYCPTLYSGVSSQVLTMSEAGVSSTDTNSHLKEHETSLTDEEIKGFYKANQLLKESSKSQLQNTRDLDEFAPNDQLRQEFEDIEFPLKNGKTSGNGNIHGNGRNKFEFTNNNYDKYNIWMFVGIGIVVFMSGMCASTIVKKIGNYCCKCNNKSKNITNNGGSFNYQSLDEGEYLLA